MTQRTDKLSALLSNGLATVPGVAVAAVFPAWLPLNNAILLGADSDGSVELTAKGVMPCLS